MCVVWRPDSAFMDMYGYTLHLHRKSQQKRGSNIYTPANVVVVGIKSYSGVSSCVLLPLLSTSEVGPVFEQRRVCLRVLGVLLRSVADETEAGQGWRCFQCRTWIFRMAVGGSRRVQEHPCFLLVVLYA